MQSSRARPMTILTGNPLGRRYRPRLRYRHPRLAAMLGRVDWILLLVLAPLVLICASPTAAGIVGRGALLASLVLTGLMSEKSEIDLATNLHW